ncbi:MAG TPA: S41 family peptidase [Flavobacteriia bacterium]|jgi:carboxyl-terminal processing protease|nr:S41 family peptidase [Flavobacteriia bacterium]
MKTKKYFWISFIVIAISLTFSFKSDFFEVAKQLEIYNSVFKELNMYYIDEINPAETTTNSINKMLKELDPYTHYFDEQTAEDAKIKSRGSYGGIGASSSFKNKNLIIREVYEDTPASKVGLKAGDEIIKIDNLLVKDFKGEAINSLLKGLPNTSINISILRNGKKLSKQITRETIEIDPVPFHKMIDDQVGYMAFVKFNKKASKRVKEAYEDLKDEGMTKLIIDVRGNPGGLLNEVVKIVNYFVPKDQIVVTTKAKVKKWSATYKTTKEPIDLEIPIIVLIDGKSASASEILSGSLQDLDRGVVMGERSFGKGLVQRYRKLPYGTQMKLTIAKYYTPSGRCIQELDYANRDEKTGIVPKFDKNNRNLFRTLNGRKVYDGGGVEPDIKIERPEKTIATKALFKSDAIFNFAKSYIENQAELENPKDFTFSDSDYLQFLEYLKQKDTTFITETESEFNKAFKKAKENHFDASINQNYLALMQNIKTAKIKDLEINKEAIKEYLSDEILKQRFYKKGMYINKFTHDPVIKNATRLLHNDNKYSKILK